MKKEFIDYMYNIRALVKMDIERLEELDKQPKDGNCQGCGDEIRAELRIRRSQSLSIDDVIEKYFQTHSLNR